MNRVIALRECTPEVASQVGGKAVGLGRLLGFGFDVPDGFAITTDAYRDAIREAGLQDEIAARLENAGDRTDNREVSEAIRALLDEAALGAALAAEIEAAYAELGDDVPVAVRSSATAEDTANASFAGQQDTYLWISGIEEVKRHVARCWGSLFTPHAIAYRSRFGIDADGLAMGVVVQRMVPASAAGVMMTLDPASGDRSQIYIESAFGLGEIVVRGEVSPDCLRYDKDPVRLRHEEIATKEREYRFSEDEGAVVLLDVDPARRGERSITTEVADRVAELGARIERAFGMPMDIEWAVAGDDVYLLQARPETVWSRRAPTDAPAEVIGRNDDWDPLMSRSEDWMHWTTSNLGEAMPGVQTPLSWTVWARAMEHAPREAAYRVGALTRVEAAVPDAIDDRFIRVFYGRAAMQVQFAATLGDRMPGTTGPATVQHVFGRVPEGLPFSPTRRRYPTIAWRLPATFSIVPHRLHRLAREQDDWWRRSVTRAEGLDRAGATALFHEALDRLDQALMWQTIGFVAVMQPLYEALGQLVKRAGAGDVSTLAGASGGAELEVVSDIWRASRDEVSLADVIAHHGFHGPAEGELSSRVWREDDEPIRRMIDRYRERDASADPTTQDAARRKSRRALEQEVLAALPRPARPVARLLLKLARERLPLRGVTKRSYVQGFDVARAAARRIGTHLADDGILEDAEDVFFLTADELTGTLPNEVQETIRKRRARRDAYRKLTLPGEWSGQATPEFLGPEQASNGTGETTVTGVGVSAGVVEGIARVVTNPDFGEVESDEILIAPTTDPSWCSIMFVSSALVVDIGGALSHAAVVAREMGIPCIVNTRTGTRDLRTGDRIRVDGTAGTVEVLERSIHSHSATSPVKGERPTVRDAVW